MDTTGIFCSTPSHGLPRRRAVSNEHGSHVHRTEQTDLQLDIVGLDADSVSAHHCDVGLVLRPSKPITLHYSTLMMMLFISRTDSVRVPLHWRACAIHRVQFFEACFSLADDSDGPATHTEAWTVTPA
jgi:hypothetical protein